jgi:hypothetical protein
MVDRVRLPRSLVLLRPVPSLLLLLTPLSITPLCDGLCCAGTSAAALTLSLSAASAPVVYLYSIFCEGNDFITFSPTPLWPRCADVIDINFAPFSALDPTSIFFPMLPSKSHCDHTITKSTSHTMQISSSDVDLRVNYSTQGAVHKTSR